jgi:hypothetical protein
MLDLDLGTKIIDLARKSTGIDQQEFLYGSGQQIWANIMAGPLKFGVLHVLTMYRGYVTKCNKQYISPCGPIEPFFSPSNIIKEHSSTLGAQRRWMLHGVAPQILGEPSKDPPVVTNTKLWKISILIGKSTISMVLWAMISID